MPTECTLDTTKIWDFILLLRIISDLRYLSPLNTLIWTIQGTIYALRASLPQQYIQNTCWMHIGCHKNVRFQIHWENNLNLQIVCTLSWSFQGSSSKVDHYWVWLSIVVHWIVKLLQHQCFTDLKSEVAESADSQISDYQKAKYRGKCFKRHKIYITRSISLLCHLGKATSVSLILRSEIVFLRFWVQLVPKTDLIRGCI